MTSFAAEAAGLRTGGSSGRASPPTWPCSTRRRCATARLQKPNQYSEGFRYVAVNGVLVVDGNKLTGKTPGKGLRGPGYQTSTAAK